MQKVEQGIIIKSPQEIALMRQAGRLLAEVLVVLREKAAAGMTTADLDSIAAREIAARKATPSFLGYRGYPAHICVSVNEEIVHGIPGPRILKEGDIVGIDAGLIYQGFQADSAMTIGIGQISAAAQRLIDVTRSSLDAGITAAKGGGRISDIGAAVQEVAEAAGYSVVREYVGHGIGQAMHEDPQVPNYGPPGRGALLRPGMALAIEPMVNIGGHQTKVAPDRWTVSTADGSLSAHFEHSIAVTEGEAEILTQL
jgi:methionyl aminopeptidase